MVHEVLAHGQLALLLLALGVAWLIMVNCTWQSKAAYLRMTGNQGKEEARALQGHVSSDLLLPPRLCLL